MTPRRRLLHVGWGFTPFRGGGLIAYAEDLMRAQVASGHEVSYFFAGRHAPLPARPRLRRWSRDGVAMFEIRNSPIVPGHEAGTRRPDLELDEPHSERLFERVLGEVGPDVVHVQELAGLPSSVLGIARERGLPVVMTLQDYFPLCPTLKLRHEHCRTHAVGAGCRAACTGAPARRAAVAATAVFEAERAARAALGAGRARALRARAAATVGPARPSVPTPPPRGAGEWAPGAAYQRRRDVNVARLNEVDLLLAQSHRVAELYAEAGVDRARLRPVELTLAHVEHLIPEPPEPLGSPLRFATLNGCASEEKGSRVVADAVERLDDDRVPYELRVLGTVDPAVHARLARSPNVVLWGAYGAGGLDAGLHGVDVGLIPSTWEEAYGYVGPEMLAKGIPLIAHAIGGIVDYAREGETGWVSRSASADELAALMRRAVERPDEVVALRRSLAARRGEIVRPFADHASEMDAIYEELLGAGA